MEAYLEELGLAHYIRRSLKEDFFENVPADDQNIVLEKRTEARTTKASRRKCKSILIHKIADSHLDFIKGKSSPKEIWQTLEQFPRRKVLLEYFTS